MSALAVAGCSTTNTTGASTMTGRTTNHPAGSSGTRLTWHSCGKTFRCATLVVPVSYNRPHGDTLRIAVIELPATDGSHAAPDILLNPGGPGASGIEFLRSSAGGFPATLRRKFDLVSFDPRGVGASSPVECAANLAQVRELIAAPPAPIGAAGLARFVATTKQFDALCAEHTSHALLANVSTEAEARDLDRLRAALGQSKLNYLGLSYGTYLGTLYAERFGAHVRAMVFDGAVDPSLSQEALDRAQSLGFERDLHDFFNWCSSSQSCTKALPLGASSSYHRVMSRLEAGGTVRAALVQSVGGAQNIDYGTALAGVTAALYSKSSWPYLAQAISQAMVGDGIGFAALAFAFEGISPNGTFSNLVAANSAINCVDRPVPTDLSQYEASAAQLAKIAPDFGAAGAWGPLICAYWPVPPTGRIGRAHLTRPLPILVVGSTRDPATPYAWAQSLTTQLSGAELLTRSGDGHTGYFSSGCVRGLVDDYFSTLARPPSGTICASGA
jgi:pimeloyl-ACP methyl ester carboxylesterase